jgi:pimeloyl-ACP methyl ester carboxylesterase
LLLIHGAWGDAQSHWRKVWDALSEDHTVVAPDLPGWGDSTRLAHGSCSDLADAMAEALRREGLVRARVVGNSFGAGVAWRLAADQPERVERLVLVNGGPLPALPAWLRKTVALAPVKALMLAGMRRSSFSPEVITRALVEPESFSTGFVERAVDMGPLAAEIGFDAVRYQHPVRIRITAPVSLLWGDRDSLIPWPRAQSLAKSLGASLTAVPGAGHIPPMQCPEDFLIGLRRIVGAPAV